MASVQPAKRKLQSKSLVEKYNALNEIEEGNSCISIAKKYGVAKNTMSNSVTLPQAKTVTYGLNSITYQSAKHWNEMQEHLNLDMYSERATLVNKCIFDYFIESYN